MTNTANTYRDIFIHNQDRRLQVFPTPKHNPRPPTRRYPLKITRDEPQTVSPFYTKENHV